MLHASTRNLITKLCDLTEQGDIPWREGKSGAMEFETEGYVVEIIDAPPAVRVLNSEGGELEHASADDLSAAPWLESGDTFADRVTTMARQARRIARGTEHAISRILSSLSAPPKAETIAAIEEDETIAADTTGVESEAAMAAAVADMAMRLKRTPLDSPAPEIPQPETAAAEPSPETEPEPEPAKAAEAAVEAAPEAPTPPAPRSGVRSLSTAGADRITRSKEMFGRTRSFSVSAGRSHHRPTPEARPVSSLGKITATGLIISGLHATTRQQMEATPAPAEPSDITPETATTAPPEAPRPPPEPASPDVYKPWV
ncbi:MAG: hypothetical protein GC155_12840 [Alphaproteobacteria bacterium]|nr:hypothetical protein [Alphaproteobacteria bacterium]